MSRYASLAPFDINSLWKESRRNKINNNKLKQKTSYSHLHDGLTRNTAYFFPYNTTYVSILSTHRHTYAHQCYYGWPSHLNISNCLCTTEIIIHPKYCAKNHKDDLEWTLYLHNDSMWSTGWGENNGLMHTK